MEAENSPQVHPSERTEAYTSIVHTMSLYHVQLDEGDFVAFGKAFADNAVFETTSGTRLVGRENICTTFAKRREERLKSHDPDRIFQRHHLTTRFIEIHDSESASAISYVMLMSEIGLDHFGTYRDTFRNCSGDWLISHRRSQVEWISPQSRFRSGIGIGNSKN